MPRLNKASSKDAVFVRDAALTEEIDRWIAAQSASASPDAPRWTRAQVVRCAVRRWIKNSPARGGE